MTASNKRTKRPYRPRLVNVPVTQGLVDQYAQDLRFPLMAAELGHFSTDAFDKIGAALNVVWAALELKQLADTSYKAVIEGGMRTMNEVSKRGDGTGIWKLTPIELASVTAAANKAEQALPRLTGIDLRNAMVEMAKVRAKAREEERMAA